MTKRIQIFWGADDLAVYINGVFKGSFHRPDFMAGDPDPELEEIAGSEWRDLVRSGNQLKDVCAVLVKKFHNFPDKIIYRGTLKKCKKMIPPSKKDQFEIRLNGES